jgi:hypothetical protein
MKSATEKAPGRRTSRKATKELTPVIGAPGSILFASALKTQTRKHGNEATRRKAARQLPPPEALAALTDAKVRPLQFGILGRIFSWCRVRVGAAATNQLRLTETVSLGEKRFVAIIHVEGRKFLIGGGTGGVNLLTQLDEPA